MTPEPVPAATPELLRVAQAGGPTSATVQQLLHAVRVQLGMEVAWTSEFVGGNQVFRFVDAVEGALAPAVGAVVPLTGSYCARVLDGRVPHLIPDARQEPATALLDATRELRIGSYLGVPLLAADGSATGMLCAISDSVMHTLSERDVQTMRLLAQLLHDLQVQAMADAEVEAGRRQLRDDVERVVAGVGRWPVLQPIVETERGAVVGYEALTRFDSSRTPAQWFDAAERVGLSAELELATAASALDLLRTGKVPGEGSLSINLSPATIVGADLTTLLLGLDLSRVVIEVTEHAPVIDYAELVAVLAPWRAQGLRLAIDDAGAGYASLQHVLMCTPDLIKLDMALVRGVDTDPVRRALLGAVVQFALSAGIGTVAEGVETEAERTALHDLGVRMVQGFLTGHPVSPG